MKSIAKRIISAAAALALAGSVFVTTGNNDDYKVSAKAHKHNYQNAHYDHSEYRYINGSLHYVSIFVCSCSCGNKIYYT